MGLHSSASAARRSTQRGFTLIEVFIVMAIVGLIFSLGIKGFRSLARSDLRSSASRLQGSMRFLFDRASTTGKTHRLVLDLEGARYWAEVSDDKFYSPRDSESPEALRRRETLEAEEDEEAAARREKAAQEAESRYGSGSSAKDSSFDMSKLEVGEFKPKRARFAAFKDLVLKPVKLKNTVLRSVYTPRVDEPLTTGRAYIYFYPLGQTEQSIVTLSDKDGETIYSLVAHPVTGRVKIYSEEIKPAGRGAITDDEGNRTRE
jgi:general secretion pathway protein H